MIWPIGTCWIFLKNAMPISRKIAAKMDARIAEESCIAPFTRVYPVEGFKSISASCALASAAKRRGAASARRLPRCAFWDAKSIWASSCCWSRPCVMAWHPSVSKSCAKNPASTGAPWKGGDGGGWRTSCKAPFGKRPGLASCRSFASALYPGHWSRLSRSATPIVGIAYWSYSAFLAP